MWQRFNPEFQQLSFPSSSISVVQVWSTVGHACSIKEMEWGRTRGTHGGSNSVWYQWPLSWMCRMDRCTDQRIVQTILNIEHTSIGLAYTRPIVLMKCWEGDPPKDVIWLKWYIMMM